MREPFAFRWPVPRDGFEWREEGGVRILRPRGWDGPLHWRSYCPLEEYPALFRTFAEVEHSEDGLQAFADEYGCLWLDPVVDKRTHSLSRFSERRDDPLATAARMAPFNTYPAGRFSDLDQWDQAARAMREALRLWEQLTSPTPDEDFLRACFHWLGAPGIPPVVIWKLDFHAGPFPKESPDDELAGSVLTVANHHGDVIGVAWELLRLAINSRLFGRVLPQLVWTEDRERERPALQFAPVNLYGCLWFQLARAIDGDRNYYRCKMCGKWGELKRGKGEGKGAGNRSTRQYCSSACRVKAHLERQAEARRLHAGGMKFRNIARQLGTDVATVKSWVTGSKG
jgi:hypothetical protein